MNLYSVLVRPLVTEKSMNSQGVSKYTFIIAPNSNKIDVIRAVESMYSANVKKVNIVPIREKIRIIGRSKIHTKRKSEKKAIVTLKKGSQIDVMKMHEEKNRKTKNSMNNNKKKSNKNIDKITN